MFVQVFTERFYRGICGARLKPVLETIQLMKELGVWVEVTTLRDRDEITSSSWRSDLG